IDNQHRHRRKPPHRLLRPRQPHYPRPVRQLHRHLVLPVPPHPHPQLLHHFLRLPHPFPRLPQPRTRHQHQTPPLRPRPVYRLHRRHRRLPPLPRTIQNPPLRLRPQHFRLPLIRLEPHPPRELHHVLFLQDARRLRHYFFTFFTEPR